MKSLEKIFLPLQFVQPMSVPMKSHELLNKMNSNGLGITYQYTRTVSVFSPKMVSLELTFTNHGDNPLEAIKMGNKVTITIKLYS